MKARIPKHREFIIQFAEDYEKQEECWGKLQEIMMNTKNRANLFTQKLSSKTMKKKLKLFRLNTNSHTQSKKNNKNLKAVLLYRLLFLFIPK